MSRYGWKPDIPDRRDKPYGCTFPSKDGKIKGSVDLRKDCSPVESQGQLSSCTAHALTSAYELTHNKEGKPSIELSRLFLYYNERAMEGTINQDNGAYIRDGIKSLVKRGCCVEDLWTYSEASFAVKPTADCYLNALEHQVISYQRLNSLTDMLSCLSDGFPFVFGFSVYESFESTGKDGIMPMPGDKERLQGGHAVCCVGHDTAKRQLIIKNSWGIDFGDAGYFYMPFEYVVDRNLSDDFWSLRNVE
jgi:C1A family cysteine protease